MQESPSEMLPAKHVHGQRGARIRARRLPTYAVPTVLILALILIGIPKLARNNNSADPDKGLPRLPRIDLVSDNGARISNKRLKGKNVYVQFVDTSYQGDIATLETVFAEWGNSGLMILGIVNDYDDFLKKSKLRATDVNIIHLEYGFLKELFRSPKNISTFHIYDKAGREIASGQSIDSYRNRVRVFLDQLINGKYFAIDSFVDEKKRTDEIEWLQQFSDYMRNNAGKAGFLFGYFTSICDACLTGAILNKINEFSEMDADNFGVLLILGKDYTNDDIFNMRLALKIGYDIALQSPLLSETVRRIDAEFGENTLNNTVFFVNAAGKILKVFHSHCECWNSFSSYIDEFPFIIRAKGSKEE